MMIHLLLKRRLLLIAYTFLALQAASQKSETGFDIRFDSTKGVPRYLVITNKVGEVYHREAYYVPEKRLAMRASYIDERCTIPDGQVLWYYSNKKLKSVASYKAGVLSGPTIRFHENAMMSDSITYIDGKVRGDKLSWDPEGFLIDSSHWDNDGNAVEISWYPSGVVSVAGKWVADTARDHTWKYFHANGNIMAQEEYERGKRVSLTCFDSNGKPLVNSAYEDRKARFPGGDSVFQVFIEKHIDGAVPIRNHAKSGLYEVWVKFTIEKDGTLSNFQPLTKFGFGMEQEAVRVLKRSPKWIPALRFGIPVQDYRTQQIPFWFGKDLHVEAAH